MSGEPLIRPDRAALFGKLPAHGDFIRRGDAALVRRLDTWLTGEIERLASQLGDAYATRLSMLPVWAFTLPKGWAGALAASHDRTGRVFPVVGLSPGGRPVAGAAAAILAETRDGALGADATIERLIAASSDTADTSSDARWWRALDAETDTFATTDLPTGDDFARLLEGTD